MTVDRLKKKYTVATLSN